MYIIGCLPSKGTVSQLSVIVVVSYCGSRARAMLPSSIMSFIRGLYSFTRISVGVLDLLWFQLLSYHHRRQALL